MFFSGIKNLNDLRSEYKKLAFIHHPDMGGDTLTMQNLNNEFDALLKKLALNDDKINIEFESNFKDVINTIVNLQGLNIEICGAWIWISGNTRDHKETLKSVGCRWANKKKMWYFRDEENKKTYRTKPMSINAIRNTYGSTNVESKQQRQVR